MFVGNFTTGSAVTGGTNIGITPVLNSNNRIRYNKETNEIEFPQAGLYKVTATLAVTSVSATPIEVQIYVNGVAVPGAVAIADVTASTGSVTVALQDALRVVYSNISDVVKLSVRCDERITLSGGNIIIEYIR